MRFLADESCDFSVVRALCAAGHDVLAVSEIAPRADDQTVMDLAVRERRTLLTEDKDFGNWSMRTRANPVVSSFSFRHPRGLTTGRSQTCQRGRKATAL